MTRYRIEIRITPREGLLDPQGRAVESALADLGYRAASGVRIGRLVHLSLEADTEWEAEARVREMCERLIANPVTEDYEIEIADDADRG